jgi:hypothetical protein
MEVLSIDDAFEDVVTHLEAGVFVSDDAFELLDRFN